VILRGLRGADRDPIEGLLHATSMFTEDEILVALELVDVGLGRREGSGYLFLVAEDGDGVAGYACYGETPATEGTWDLYWIAVDPARQGRGIGRRLVEAVERDIAEHGGRLVVVETAGKDSYAPTRAFYERTGYPEHARIRDFYRPGDDKVIHVKKL
jgi:ribosomal protein S18 acetylase RimI-like enzyme